MSDFSFRLETSAGHFYAFVVAEDRAAAGGRLDDWIEKCCRDPNFTYRLIDLKALPTRVANTAVLSLWDRGPDSIGKSWWYAMGRGAAYEQFYQETFGQLVNPDERRKLADAAVEAGKDIFEYISQKEQEAWE